MIRYSMELSVLIGLHSLKQSILKILLEAIADTLKRHYSQEKFAELTGIQNFQHLGKIEKGNVDMRVSTLLKILRALDLKLEDLITL